MKIQKENTLQIAWQSQPSPRKMNFSKGCVCVYIYILEEKDEETERDNNRSANTDEPNKT